MLVLDTGLSHMCNVQANPIAGGAPVPFYRNSILACMQALDGMLACRRTFTAAACDAFIHMWHVLQAVPGSGDSATSVLIMLASW
jgi:hypothetical protein